MIQRAPGADASSAHPVSGNLVHAGSVRPSRSLHANTVSPKTGEHLYRQQATIRPSEGALMKEPRQRIRLIPISLWIVTITLGLHPLSVSLSEDWSQFRGPNGTGISSAINLPLEFGPDRNVL